MLTAAVIQLFIQAQQAQAARREIAAIIIERIQQRSAMEMKLPREWTDSTKLIREDRSR